MSNDMETWGCYEIFNADESPKSVCECDVGDFSDHLDVVERNSKDLKDGEEMLSSYGTDWGISREEMDEVRSLIEQMEYLDDHEEHSPTNDMKWDGLLAQLRKIRDKCHHRLMISSWKTAHGYTHSCTQCGRLLDLDNFTGGK